MGALFAFAGALSYSELGINFPSLGGEYVYLTHAYGPEWGFMTGWVSFFAGFSAPIAAAALAFSDYLGHIFPAVSRENSTFTIGAGAFSLHLGASQMVACSLIALFTILNCFGVSRMAKIQNTLTATKLVGAGKSPGQRLGYICLGSVPASASHVQVAGYSTFLRAEWLAVFNVGPKDFQTMVANTKLVPVDGFEFRKMLGQSSLKTTRLYQRLPSPDNAQCFKRVFNESQERERGSIFAMFDPATSAAIVVREYHD